MRKAISNKPSTALQAAPAQTAVKSPVPAPVDHLDANAAPELRRTMIAEAAYYRAEKRGFNGGSALEDWLQAENEVDAALKCAPAPR